MVEFRGVVVLKWGEKSVGVWLVGRGEGQGAGDWVIIIFTQ